MLCFRALTQRLEPDQPFYDFQPRDQSGEREAFLESEGIAANYVRELRALQPDGSYFMAGHSSGDLVTFEMTRQLHGQGQDATLMALFDIGLRAKAASRRNATARAVCDA